MSSATPRSGDATARSEVQDLPETGEIDRDELFHLLRNRRRRFALHHLKHEDEPVDVGKLATQIAAWENEVAVEAVTSKQRRRVYNALQQTHLPELRETGVLRRDRREVELTEQAETLDIYLEVVPGQDIPWSEYYLALGAISVALLTITTLNVGPFALVSAAAVGAFVVAALLVSACVHYYYQHESILGGEEVPPELRGD